MPPPLTNLDGCPTISRCRRQGLLWQDAAKSVPAVAEGDPVRVVVCPWTAKEYTAPADANRAKLHSIAGSWALLVGSGAGWAGGQYYDFTGVASIPLTCHFATMWGNGNGTGALLAGGANSQKLKGFDTTSGFRGGREGVSNWSYNTSGLLVGDVNVVGLSYAATGDAYNWLGGAKDGLAQATVEGVGLAANVTRIFANTSNSEPWGGYVFGWGVWTAGLSDDDNAAAQNWLLSEMSTRVSVSVRRGGAFMKM